MKKRANPWEKIERARRMDFEIAREFTELINRRNSMHVESLQAQWAIRVIENEQQRLASEAEKR